MNQKIKPFVPLVLIFVLGLIGFLCGVRTQFSLVTTARYAVFALSMHHFGLTYFPSLYGVYPYPDYPATQTWLAAFFMWLFDSTKNSVIVLPNAIVAALLLVQIYLLAALHNKRWGVFSVLMAMVTVELYAQGSSLGNDIFVASSACAAFHCAYSAKLLNKPRRLLWLPLIIIYGFAFRGILGAALTFFPVFLFYLLERDYKSLCKWTILAFIVSIASFAFLLYLAYLQGGRAFVHSVWFMEFAGRFAPQAKHNTPSVLHYLNHILSHYAIGVIVSIVVAVGLMQRVFSKAASADLQLIRYLILWALIVVLLLAIPDSRRARYVLAVSPAFAIVSAYLFIAVNPNTWLKVWRGIIVTFALVFPFVVLVVVAVLLYKQKLPATVHPEIALAVLVILSFCSFSVAVFMSRYTHKELAAILIGVIAYIFTYALIANPLIVVHTHGHEFIATLNKARKPNQTIIFYHMKADDSNLRITANTRPFFKPIVIKKHHKLRSYPYDALIVVPAEYKVKHFGTEIYAGEIGGRHYKIFRTDNKVVENR